MIKILIAFFVGILVSVISFTIPKMIRLSTSNVPIAIPTPTPLPLLGYRISYLANHIPAPSQINLKSILKKNTDFTSYSFSFQSSGKSVSGLLNLPPMKAKGVILLLRGFVEKEKFSTGEGTRRTAEAFARDGYITAAPDFLGYGDSDNEASDAMESRFETYTTALTLLESLKNPQSLPVELTQKLTDSSYPLFLWGHSNGGHIALTLLTITKEAIPTVLWAPVTKPFPYSVLYFTDEYDDEGKFLRGIISDFEKNYDVKEFSPSTYYADITAPIQLHQGTADEEVPLRWSDQFNSAMKKSGKTIDYFTYPGENHNFNLGAWPLVINRSLTFYNSYLSR